MTFLGLGEALAAVARFSSARLGDAVVGVCEIVLETRRSALVRAFSVPHNLDSCCLSPGTRGQRLTFSPGSWGHPIARVMGPGSRVIGPWIARVMGPADRQGHGATP
jgi:hypothetical protein